MTPFTSIQVDALLHCYVAGLCGYARPEMGALSRAEMMAVAIGYGDQTCGMSEPRERTVAGLVAEVGKRLREEPAEDDAEAAHLDGLACGARDVLNALEVGLGRIDGMSFNTRTRLEALIASERAKLPAPPKTYADGVRDVLRELRAWNDDITDIRLPETVLEDVEREMLGEVAK